jgi:hypothetical protein
VTAIDASLPDADLSCTANEIVCDDATSHYTECDPNGVIAFEMDCPVSCATGVEKCLDLVPSNDNAAHGLRDYLDASPGNPDAVFTGTSSIDTTTGDITIAGVGQVPAVWHGALVTDDGGITMRVYSFNRLEMHGTINVSGSYAVVFLVNADVDIDGVLDVSANGKVSGPGAVTSGTCIGASTAAADPQSGGGGGARSQLGQKGGDAGNGTSGGAGGIAFNEPAVIPLHGGCAGGKSTSGAANAYGGGGGGAIQIVSRTRITVGGAAATGVIDASGGGGAISSFASTRLAGGGGGSGGAILMEAPQVLVDGSGVVISTKGGSGAAPGLLGEAGAAGHDGGFDASAAPGGTLAGFPTGGEGGIVGTSPTAGGAGTNSTMDGAGGGGGMGTTRFNIMTGSVVPQNGAAIRSASSSGQLVTRQLP